MKTTDTNHELLRHTVATVAYRGSKAIRNAPESFADFKVGETTKTPLGILSHIGDLFDWALSQAKDEEVWNDSAALPWKNQVERFFESITRFDDYLALEKPVHVPLERLFQGPIADALTHVGQIAMLRRLAGSPIRGENFFKANIKIGQVTENQPKPQFEFD